MKKWIVSVVVLIVSLGFMAMAGVFGVLVFFGPHSDTLPQVLQVPVVLLIWIAVLGVPIFLSYKTFLKYSKQEKAT